MMIRICDGCKKPIGTENEWNDGAGVCPECGDELCHECAEWNGHDECSRCQVDEARLAKEHVGLELIVEQLDLRAWMHECMDGDVLSDEFYRKVALHAIVNAYEEAVKELGIDVRPRLVNVVEGGIIQVVYADRPVKVINTDFDTEGLTEEEEAELGNSFDTKHRCFVGEAYVEVNEKVVKHYEGQVE